MVTVRGRYWTLAVRHNRRFFPGFGSFVRGEAIAKMREWRKGVRRIDLIRPPFAHQVRHGDACSYLHDWVRVRAVTCNFYIRVLSPGRPFMELRGLLGLERTICRDR